MIRFPADHIAKTTDELGNVDSAFEHIDEANIHLVFCDQHEKHQEGKYTSHDQDTGYRSDASNQKTRPVRRGSSNRNFVHALRALH